jgi:hypothetical protein
MPPFFLVLQFLFYPVICRALSANKMNDDNNNNESTKGTVILTVILTPTQLLKTFEDVLHNRIAKKKIETRKHNEIAETEKIWTEIGTLQWVLSKSLNIRRQLVYEQYYYYYYEEKREK